VVRQPVCVRDHRSLRFSERTRGPKARRFATRPPIPGALSQTPAVGTRR